MNSLRNKVFLFLLLPIIFSGIGFFVLMDGLMRVNFQKHLEEGAVSQTQRISSLVRDAVLNKKYENLSQIIFDEKYLSNQIRFIAIYNEKEELIATTFLNDYIQEGIVPDDKDFFANHGYYLSGKNNGIYNVDKAIEGGLYKVGLVRVGFDFSRAADDFLNSIYVFIIIGILAFVIVGILAHRLSNIILRPIFELNKVTNEFAAGNFDYRAKVLSSDEIGQLSVNFNKMANTLGKTEKNLKKERNNIQKKVKELEIWQRSAMDRELKMIDLKEENKKLKSNKNV